MLIDSVPPATMTEPIPHMICCAPRAMAWRPDEQNRFTVCAGTWYPSPARKVAIRATFIPCSASGIAQPRITSSICAGSSPGVRSTAARIAVAARSSGRTVCSVPRGAFPTGVRTPVTITASFIGPSWCLFVKVLLSPGACRGTRRVPRCAPGDEFSVAQDLTGLEEVSDSLLGLRLLTDRDEGLPLEIQDVSLVDPLRLAQVTATHDVGDA